MAKYELTNEYILTKFENKVYRIRALKDFGDIKAGDLGGFVESECNLSQDGDCWVYDNAEVFDDARVYGNAKVYNDAIVYDYAKVYNDADVYGNAKVYNYARVYDDAKIYGNAEVFNDAEIYGTAHIYGNAEVYGDAKVYGDVEVHGNATICGNAEIVNTFDYIVIKNSWSSGRYFTYTKSNQMWCVGCFYGTGEELIAKAYKDSKLSGDHYKAYVDFVTQLEQIGK